MRKALLKNENVGKIAEDPKKMAFLKAIEDRDDDDDNDFLDRPAEDSFRVEMDTQEGDAPPSQQESTAAPENTSVSKQPLQDSAPSTTNMRPPAHKRRTPASKKPTSLAEIQESVSFLVEEPGSHNHNNNAQSSSDSELEYIPETQVQHTHTNPRRTNSNPIIDRLTLKRQSSSCLSNVTAVGGQMAFHAPSASSANFVPSLLRRATTSSLYSMSGSGGGEASGGMGGGHAATERAAGGGEKGFVKKGGGKRCSVNFAVREQQKRGLVEGVERRKLERRRKMARESQSQGGVGRLSRMGTWDG